jgi:glutamate N-acetyltransferase/amino-acid N-acetyltransferase
MLAFIFTDATFAAPTLDRLLRAVVDDSFNMLSVDSDTSTSDTCAILANGRAGVVDEVAFAEALAAGCVRMTEVLARDGEGANRMIRATVRNALNRYEARRVAKSLVNSPLVKTMVAGADPNVGRLLMAVGKVFECTIRPDTTDAWINGTPVVRSGKRLDFEDAAVRQTLTSEVVELEVSLGVGTAEARAYGCDLTAGYIEENAAYYSS